MQPLSQSALVFCTALLLLLSSGCTSSRVQIQSAECQVITEEGQDKPASMAFVSTFSVGFMEQQQIIYHVGLVNSRDEPVRSADERFRDQATGMVAAAKTLMVLESPWTFEDTRVVIPFDQLELAPADLPARAVISITTSDGTILASREVPIPLAGPPAPAAPPSVAATRRPRERTISKVAPEPTWLPPGDEKRVAEAPSKAAGGTGNERPPKSSDRAASSAKPAPTTKPAPVASERQPASRPASKQPTTRPRDSAPAKPQAETPTRSPNVTPARPMPGSAATRPVPATQPAKAGAPATRPGVGDGKPLPPRTPTTRPAAPKPEPRDADRPSTRPAVPVDEGSSVINGKRARRYVVRKGDTLSTIAKDVLGSYGRWPEIFEMNREMLETPDRLREGMEIYVPAVDGEGG